MNKKKLKLLGILAVANFFIITNIFMLHLGSKYNNISKITSPLVKLNTNKKGNIEGIYLNPTLLFSKKLKSNYQNNYLKLYVAIMGTIGYFLFFKTKKKELDYYGTAKFASSKEIEEMKILDSSDGVILGLTKDDKLISHNGVEHIMVMAPTRSGKGVGCVLPTLWTWRSSIIVNDIKGECWDLTSGFRRSVLGQKCIYFNPMDDSGEGISYNPLALVKVGTGSEQEDARLVASTLIDIDGKGESDHWISSAINLLTAVILHVKYVNINATFLDVMEFLADPKEPLVDKLGRVIAKKLDDMGDVVDDERYTPFNHYNSLKEQMKNNLSFLELYNQKTTLHPIVGSTFSTMFATPDKERGSIFSSCLNKLGIFKDPRIMKNIGRTDITPREIMDNRISLYLITPPRAINMTRPLFRLIITQTIFELTDKMEFGNRKKIDKEKNKKPVPPKNDNKSKSDEEKNKRILFLIDEFPALGNLSLLETALAYIAGYGLKVLLITQAISQLQKIYGKENSIIANCHCQLYYTPNDSETPKLISDMLGTKTITIKTQSKSKGVVTYSENYQSRALMTAGEVRTLPYEETLLMITGKNPIHGKKLFWFKHEKFKNNVNYNIPYKSYLNLVEELENLGFTEYVLEYLIYLVGTWKILKELIEKNGKKLFLKEILYGCVVPEVDKEITEYKSKSDEEKKVLKEKVLKEILPKAEQKYFKEYLADFSDKDYIRYLIEKTLPQDRLEEKLEENLKLFEANLPSKDRIKKQIISSLKNLKTEDNQAMYLDKDIPVIEDKTCEYVLKSLSNDYSITELLIDINIIIERVKNYDKFIEMLVAEKKSIPKIISEIGVKKVKKLEPEKDNKEEIFLQEINSKSERKNSINIYRNFKKLKEIKVEEEIMEEIQEESNSLKVYKNFQKNKIIEAGMNEFKENNNISDDELVEY